MPSLKLHLKQIEKSQHVDMCNLCNPNRSTFVPRPSPLQGSEVDYCQKICKGLSLQGDAEAAEAVAP